LFLDTVSVLQVAYLHSSDQRIQLADKRSASLVGYGSALDAGIAMSYKLTLPSVLSGRATETIAVSLKILSGLPSFAAWSSTSGIRSVMRERIRSMKPSYTARITGSGVSGEAKLVAQTMLATSVAFVEALSAFLSDFYGELTNDENKTSGE
jgi:hypothetical protein